MKKTVKKLTLILLALSMLALCFAGCGSKKKKIVIYTSAEDYCIEHMQKMLDERFPEYDIIIDYKSSGDHAAILKASGTGAGCDISHNLEYGYAQQIAAAGTFADVSKTTNFDVYVDDTVESDFYLPETRNVGAIIINEEKLKEKGLDAPKSYEDLLDPQYKGLISMPNPASSGTGYMFLLALVNEWGEDEAFEYFDKLSDNVLSFTSSGSGPVNALVAGEVAIGLGMVSNAVTKINEGNDNLKIISFEEGVPYSMYAQSVIAGKETDAAVMEVFEYLSTTVTKEVISLYYPEKVFVDQEIKINNYPEGLEYADMSNNTPERKDELLKKWNH